MYFVTHVSKYKKTIVKMNTELVCCNTQLLMSLKSNKTKNILKSKKDFVSLFKAKQV